MNAKSIFVFTRIVSRSALGASPSVNRRSSTSRIVSTSSTGSENRCGAEALLNFGSLRNRMKHETHTTAAISAKRFSGARHTRYSQRVALTQARLTPVSGKVFRGILGEIGQDKIRARPAD